MKPETPEQRAAREARLKALCEPLGLETQGSYVRIKGCGDGPVLDASAIDHGQLVPHLLRLAFAEGLKFGENKGRTDITRALEGVLENHGA